VNWWELAVGAALGALVSWWLTHLADSATYSKLATTYASYRAQVADQRAEGEKSAREALQKQIDEEHEHDADNAQIINTLSMRAESAEGQHAVDVAYIRSLLDKAHSATAAAPGRAVLQGGHQPGAAAPGEAASPDAVALCADTKLEDQLNADQLDALIQQLQGQTNAH
jgi:hypothetical protein